MTTTVATNAHNDIYILPNGNLSITTGQDAVLQACATASKLQLGEAIYQTNLGIPNFEVVWNGTPNLAIFETYLRQALLSVDGVITVTSLNISVSKNVLSYQAQIESAFGTLYLKG